MLDHWFCPFDLMCSIPCPHWQSKICFSVLGHFLNWNYSEFFQCPTFWICNFWSTRWLVFVCRLARWKCNELWLDNLYCNTKCLLLYLWPNPINNTTLPVRINLASQCIVFIPKSLFCFVHSWYPVKLKSWQMYRRAFWPKVSIEPSSPLITCYFIFELELCYLFFSQTNWLQQKTPRVSLAFWHNDWGSMRFLYRLRSSWIYKSSDGPQWTCPVKVYWSLNKSCMDFLSTISHR